MVWNREKSITLAGIRTLGGPIRGISIFLTKWKNYTVKNRKYVVRGLQLVPPQYIIADNEKDHKKPRSAEPVTEPRFNTGPQEQKRGMSLTHSQTASQYTYCCPFVPISKEKKRGNASIT
jgi:hypothetical protein